MGTKFTVQELKTSGGEDPTMTEAADATDGANPDCPITPVTSDEVKAALRKLKNLKALGICNITEAEMLKAGGDHMIQWLTQIINHLITPTKLVKSTKIDQNVDQKIENLNLADSVDTGDLRKVVKEVVQERLQKQEPSQDAMGQETQNDNTLRYTSEQEENMADEFEEELESLTHRSRLSKMTEKVRQEMTQQFDDIIDEAEEELYSEEGTDPRVDRSDAARKLANTLNKLLEKMEQKSTTETKGEGGKVDALEEEEEEEDEEPPFTTPPPKQDLRSRDQVKVRVTKIQLGDKERLQENRGNDGISAQDRRKMEETVKEELEKAGMKTQGNIEVKIITTGYYGDDDDVHLLGDEETSYFREMIVTMLMGGEEALAEQRRQQQLEENYRFKFTPASKEVLSETEHSRPETDDTDK
ncbi:Protein OS-9 [Branchiostoma belcheri]|nr:Protein OS-9 [Branchiostoma belcheri]